METDPERPIEKLLRAAARKRRQEPGGSFSLHPVTRKLLQGEVARTLGRKTATETTPVKGWWKLWPRLAFASAVVLALGLGAWLLLPRHKAGPAEQQFAQSEPARKPELAQLVSPAAAPVLASAKEKSDVRDQPKQLPEENAAVAPARLDSLSESMTALADKDASAASMKKATGNAVAETGVTVVAQTPVPASPGGAAAAREAMPYPAEQPTAAAHSSTAANQSVLRAKSPSLVVPAAAQGSGALSATTLEARLAPAAAASEPTNRARFVRAETALKEEAKDVAPASPVLTSFQVEQSGQQIRITDQDGSIYSGQVQLLNSGAGLVAGTATGARALPAPKVAERRYGFAPPSNSVADALAVPDNFFRVEGTNVSLNQRVTFTGNFLTTTNFDGSAAAYNAVPFSQSTSNLTPLLNSRIQGKVKLGNQPEFKLNAAPSK